MAKACGVNILTIFGDSKLVVEQTMNLCDAVNDSMAAYRALYNQMEGSFDGCELKHIGRGSNDEADALANIGSTCGQIPPNVFYEVISERSIKVKGPATPHPASEASADAGAAAAELSSAPATVNAVQVALADPAWTHPYIAYLT